MLHIKSSTKLKTIQFRSSWGSLSTLKWSWCSQETLNWNWCWKTVGQQAKKRGTLSQAGTSLSMGNDDFGEFFFWTKHNRIFSFQLWKPRWQLCCSISPCNEGQQSFNPISCQALLHHDVRLHPEWPSSEGWGKYRKHLEQITSINQSQEQIYLPADSCPLQCSDLWCQHTCRRHLQRPMWLLIWH